MTALPKVLPCPFCGASASVEEHPAHDGGVRFSVGCDNPDEERCMGYQSLTMYDTRREAIEGWNRRAPEPALLWQLIERYRVLASDQRAVGSRRVASRSRREEAKLRAAIYEEVADDMAELAAEHEPEALAV